jgi:hypothetical protein
MHEKYAKQGLVCISVSVDVVEDSEAVLKFLKKQKATFANYLVDERPKVWQDFFDIGGPPAVFVYDQSGKVAAMFQDYVEVEKLLKKLLDKK